MSTTTVLTSTAVPTPRIVHTTLNYFTPPPNGEKPYAIINGIGEFTADGKPRQNWAPEAKEVGIEDVRDRIEEFSGKESLDRSGFAYLSAPSVEKDFEDEEKIKGAYYEESMNYIKKVTGATRAVIFDHTIRHHRPDDTENTPNSRQPAALVHVDQTPAAALRRVSMHLPAADVPSLTAPGKRFQIINFWRPIHHPAWDFPLALCDFVTVRTGEDGGEGGDLVPMTLHFAERDGETFAVRHNETHRWKYLSGITPDEVALIKCFDSVRDGSVSTFTPHTAFIDPTTPKDSPLRESIELRALVFYD